MNTESCPFTSIVADLISGDVPLQRRAAFDLRLLAKHDPLNRRLIASAGAISPLVSLLSSLDPLLQEHAATALLNLSLSDDNRPLIASAGAVKPIVHVVGSAATAAARENAACALLRLAQTDDDLRLEIGRSGAIPRLVELLECGSQRGKKDALTALYLLCSCRENKVRAAEAGLIRPLLDLMADMESGMVDKAVYVMQAVAGAAEGRAAVVDEGGLPVMVEVVETGTQRQKEIVVGVLLKICEESGVWRAMVAREGVVPALVELSQSGTARGRQKAEALTELLRQPRSNSVREQ